MSQPVKQLEICFRFLEKDEFSRLEHIYKEYNSEIPNVNISMIYVAELVDTNEIIGFVDFVLTPMVTMFIDPLYRHSGLWAKLVEGIMPLSFKHSKTYVICAVDETAKMCEKLGLRMINSPIFVKE